MYLSILSLFSPSHIVDGRAKPKVECAAFNVLADLCAGSHNGRKAVTSGSCFKDAFDRALELASLHANDSQSSISLEVVPYAANEESKNQENDEEGNSKSEQKNLENSLVEAAYYFLSAAIVAKSAQESLACNKSFVQACFKSASKGSSIITRRAAMGIVAKLCRCEFENSELTPGNASELFRQVLGDQKDAEGHDSQGKSIQIVAAEGLLHILGKLSGEQEQEAIEDVVKVYSNVVRQRSLSKSSATLIDRKNAGELAYCLVRILFLGMRSEKANNFFGSCAIAPLIGTVQWRYDNKTALDKDEEIYWDAATCHAMEILCLWFEQGKPYMTEASSKGGLPRGLKDHVWMVAGPGKAPRKSIDFGSALQTACKYGDASTRIAAGRIWIWLNESSP